MQKTETGGRNIEQKQAAETVSRNIEQKRRPENGKTENGYGLKQKQTETHENTDTDGYGRTQTEASVLFSLWPKRGRLAKPCVRLCKKKRHNL